MCHLPYRLMKGSTVVLDSRDIAFNVSADLGAGGCGICSLAGRNGSTAALRSDQLSQIEKERRCIDCNQG